MPRGRGRGGYREPTDPAPVSGPRGLSKRTDGGPADRQPLRAYPAQKHGERQETVQQQRSAPMASNARPVDAVGVVRQAAQNFDFQPLPPFDRPTEFPDEPLTAGLSTGPGPGPEILPSADDDVIAQLRGLYLRFPTEELREVIEDAEMGGP